VPFAVLYIESRVERAISCVVSCWGVWVTYVSGNQLTALPEPIAELANLQELAMWGNQFTALPDSIAQLANLQRLGLSHNQLASLPPPLNAWKALPTFSFTATPVWTSRTRFWARLTKRSSASGNPRSRRRRS